MKGSFSEPRFCRKLRVSLVKELKAKGYLLSSHIESAFLSVPRHAFLQRFYLYEDRYCELDLIKPDENLLKEIYRNRAFPIKFVDGIARSSSSEPSIMAQMLEKLILRKGHNVLEIGAGSGYNAALMSYLVGNKGRVVSVDIDSEIAHEAEKNLTRLNFNNAKVVVADGGYGWLPGAPYDRIITTVGCTDIPIYLYTQLKPRGLLLATLKLKGFDLILALKKKGEFLHGKIALLSGFMEWQGEFATEGHTAPYGKALEKVMQGNHQQHPLPKPFVGREYMDYSLFSLLKHPNARMVIIPDKRGGKMRLSFQKGEHTKQFLLVEKKSLKTWSNTDLIEDVQATIKEWERLYKPRNEDYKVFVWFKSDNIPELNQIHFSWVIERPNSKQGFILERR